MKLLYSALGRRKAQQLHEPQGKQNNQSALAWEVPSSRLLWGCKFNKGKDRTKYWPAPPTQDTYLCCVSPDLTRMRLILNSCSGLGDPDR